MMGLPDAPTGRAREIWVYRRSNARTRGYRDVCAGHASGMAGAASYADACMRTLKGTSLLELLAAIALLATITALAMPGYQRHLQRARRTDANTLLLQVYAAQQNHFLRHGRYVVNV